MASKNILPKPSIDYFPKLMRDTPDDGTVALSNKIDELCLRWELSNLKIDTFRDPVQIPADLITELGNLLSAGILAQDGERIRRNKVAIAVQTHKVRGSFTLHARSIIDTITGFSSALVKGGNDSGQWILFSDGIIPTNNKWGVMGGGVIGDDFGLILFSDGGEVEIPGVVFIDLGNDTIPADVIADVVEALTNTVVPAYFVIFLGFIDSGKFIKYPDGEIS